MDRLAAAGVACAVVQASQVFEVIRGWGGRAPVDDTVRVPAVLFQPMAADDVVSGVARVATDAPVNGVVEIGGPEQFRFDDPIRRVLAALNDPREVLTDPTAGYYGINVSERTLVPGDGARLGETRLDDWLRQTSGMETAVA